VSESSPDRVNVLFQSERGIAAWARRNQNGEVPGLWPYGLEALAAGRRGIVSAELPPPSRLQSARNAVLPRSVRTPAAGTPRDIGLTWDENMARRMAIVQPHAEMYSGVIWLTDLITRKPGDYSAMRSVLARMSRLFVLSRAQIEPLAGFLGTDAPPIDFVRFGVDPVFYEASPYPSQPMLLSVGGDRDRDTESLFAALEIITARNPGLEVIVQSKSELTPPDGVTKVASVTHTELRDLYRRASVVVIATRPNLHVSGMTVSLEAMATARPVVITETSGISDYVVDGVTGRTTPLGSAGALADAVSGLLADPGLAERLGAAGRRDVEARFSVNHLADALAGMMDLS
jgi:hypothetical protein